MMSMRGLVMILAGMALLFTACEEEEEKRYSGIVKFTSERGGQYYVNGYGFSFEEGRNIVCSDINCTGADIVAVSLILQTEIEEVFLQSPGNMEAFHLEGSFADETEANAFFDHYDEVTAVDFTYQTEYLEPHQVWTFQSTDTKYAKFRVIEIVHYNAATYPYTEVKVEYEFQPGGSKTFSR